MSKVSLPSIAIGDMFEINGRNCIVGTVNVDGGTYSTHCVGAHPRAYYGDISFAQKKIRSGEWKRVVGVYGVDTYTTQKTGVLTVYQVQA